MKIVKIISEHKRIKKSQPVAPGFKRVEAVVNDAPNSEPRTAHIDIKQ